MSSHSPPPLVRVGVGVFVFDIHGTKFLMGQRKGSHGAGRWALPGGHLEFGESFETCARREVRKETGLDVTDPEFLTATNDVMVEEERHYVTVFMVCRVVAGEARPMVLEPDKCVGWEWVSWEDMRGWVAEHVEGGEWEVKYDSDIPGPTRRLFLPLVNLVRCRPEVHPAVLTT